MGRSSAFRWSVAEDFWVGTFSTGTMGSFQPELTDTQARAAKSASSAGETLLRVRGSLVDTV